MSKQFTTKDGAVIKYSTYGGKKIWLEIRGSTAPSVLPVTQVVTINGVQYSNISVTLKYVRSNWECSRHYAQLPQLVSNQSTFRYYTLTKQEIDDISAFIVKHWKDFFTVEKMIEADIEKENSDIKYYNGKIDVRKRQIEDMEDKIKRAEARLKKAEDKLDLYRKSSTQNVPQTSQPTTMVQNNP